MMCSGAVVCCGCLAHGAKALRGPGCGPEGPHPGGQRAVRRRAAKPRPAAARAISTPPEKLLDRYIAWAMGCLWSRMGGEMISQMPGSRLPSCRPEKPSARWMCGSATLTMVASSTTISCAAARTSRAGPGRGPPPAVVPAADLAIRVVLDRVPDMEVSPKVDLLPAVAQADSRLAPYLAGAGLLNAAAS